MRRGLLWLALLAGCQSAAAREPTRDSSDVEALSTRVLDVLFPIERVSLPPVIPTLPEPPPPPPPPPRYTGPPKEIATFLGAGVVDRVTLYKLRPLRRKGIRFMGWSVRRSIKLAPPAADELVRRLAGERSYFDGGDWGCVSDRPTGIRIQRAHARLDLVYDCGHLYLTELGHDGPMAQFSDEMVDYFFLQFEQKL